MTRRRLFNRITTGGDCTPADYVVLAFGLVFITPFGLLFITLPEIAWSLLW